MSTSDKSITVRFPSNSSAGQYKLIELPPELNKVIEAKDEEALSKVSIRGRTTDDAVLCTDTRTYSLRSVQMSNSYLILTGSNDAEDDHGKLILRDQVNEIIELVPVVPKLDRLTTLLRDNGYKLDAEAGDEDEDMEDERPKKRQRFTYDQVRGLIQASDAELDRGLREKHILSVDGNLQAIPTHQLTQFLTYILNNLVSHHASRTASIPLKELLDQLQDDHAIAPDVSRQICTWFGDMESGSWTMDVEGVVKEVGLGVLVENRHKTLTETQLLDKWKTAVGDAFENHVKLDLLAGNFVSITSDGNTSIMGYKYFPASELPTNPSQRFTDLFLTRKSWRLDELGPFLHDIAVDKKERDKLLMKFTRTSTDSDGVVWYSARVKY
ncbi:hypothetical protein FRB96_004961 [Tulasnella sp. 330]|nr:hypothetical protein FRB96_004961 [Tulasnella sp. 330]KAG8886085.1 hypothetical protein FRB97_007961 [Tulasnella sp. 331]KAG8890237.1 hypothetical protein FRB98_000148 [Tulasnella sp. 332]